MEIQTMSNAHHFTSTYYFESPCEFFHSDSLWASFEVLIVRVGHDLLDIGAHRGPSRRVVG